MTDLNNHKYKRLYRFKKSSEMKGLIVDIDYDNNITFIDEDFFIANPQMRTRIFSAHQPMVVHQ